MAYERRALIGTLSEMIDLARRAEIQARLLADVVHRELRTPLGISADADDRRTEAHRRYTAALNAKDRMHELRRRVEDEYELVPRLGGVEQ